MDRSFERLPRLNINPRASILGRRVPWVCSEMRRVFVTNSQTQMASAMGIAPAVGRTKCEETKGQTRFFVLFPARSFHGSILTPEVAATVATLATVARREH